MAINLNYKRVASEFGHQYWTVDVSWQDFANSNNMLEVITLLKQQLASGNQPAVIDRILSIKQAVVMEAFVGTTTLTATLIDTNNAPVIDLKTLGNWDSDLANANITDMRIQVDATGANLDQLTAGLLRVELETTVLPGKNYVK